MTRKFDVAVMHDFYVDRLVHGESLDGVRKMLAEKASAGGGGIHGVAQEEVRGGNAVNLAVAAARLGLRTLLITHSDRNHEQMLKEAFRGLRAELRIKPALPALTVAFEGEVNVMLGNERGASDFGPSKMDESDWEALEDSRVVCSMNWAANRKGTALLVALRRRLGREKPIYLDPADFRDNVSGFRDLLRRIADAHLVDWLSMNERESLTVAESLGLDTDNLAEVCRGVAARLGVVFDLHGVNKSYSSEGTRVAEARVGKVRARRFTGAGDVWDAGAIFGRLKGMTEPQRLKFANRAAKLYLESRDMLPPSLGQMQEGPV